MGEKSIKEIITFPGIEAQIRIRRKNISNNQSQVFEAQNTVNEEKTYIKAH